MFSIKNIMLTSAFIILTVFHAKAETQLVNTYEIVSDEFSKDIPEGKCLVKGIVYEGYTNKAVGAGTISDRSSRNNQTIITNSVGEYELYLTENDSSLYFYHYQYGEIVCWNYDFKSQHVVTLNFITALKSSSLPIMTEKPVIYLYADEEIDVRIALAVKGNISFTYPTYNQGWNVKTNTDGTITANDKKYPYLFWDGDNTALNFKLSKDNTLEGYFMHSDTVVPFLEQTLAKLGLNAHEQTDFITYWAPRIIQHNYVTVQFLIDEDYSKEIAEIEVVPKPNSQRRVYMVFRGSNDSSSLFQMVTPLFPEFKRVGFTLIEWGGSELPPIQIKG